MDESLNRIALTLLEATVTLYPANPDGSPATDSPLWTGASAEVLKLMERWIKMETRPTGAPYPVMHPLIPQYEISIARVWALPLSQLSGFRADYNRYVLDVVWTDEDELQWHRRTFYGVTISETSLESRDIESGHTDDQEFQAQYFTVASGMLDTPASGSSQPPVPPITPTVPYYVNYIGAGAPLTLYTYDANTHLFTPNDPSLTSSRAVIGYNVSGQFGIEFAGDSSPVVSTTASDEDYQNDDDYQNAGEYQSSQFIVRGGIFSKPAPDSPRLIFYYGITPVCVVTKTGLYGARFMQNDSPALADGLFGIYANARLMATLGAGLVQAKNFIIT